MVIKQQTLASSYKKGQNATKVDLHPSEIATDTVPGVVSAYYNTQLEATFSHYKEEVNKKRKKRPAPAKAYGTRHTSSPGKAESTATPSNKRPRSDGDTEGQRYLDYVRQLVSKEAALTELIQQLADQHPMTASTTDSNGRHVVVTADSDAAIDSLEQRSKPWTFVGSKLQGNVMQHPDSELPRQAVLVFIEIWKYAADQAECMAGMQEEDADAVNNSYRNFGEFWLLKLVLSELHRDLRHRLAVYAKGKTAADKQDKLLINSQLWRMLENFDCNLSELVRLLMRIIGTSAAPEDAQQEANQESPSRLAKMGLSHAFRALQAGDVDVPETDNIDSAKRNAANLLEEESVDMPVEAELFGVAELAEMASMMLNMILELYGTAEQAGLFQAQRKVVSRGQQFLYKHTRIKLDHEMVDGLVGAREVLKLVPEKATFLSALHPRDCLRLLGMAVASRLGDTSKYPLLSEYKAIYIGSKDHSGYLDADPVSILKCLMDMPQHQGKLLHKEGSLDALAVLAAMTVQSALYLNQMGATSKVFPQVLEFFKQQARGEVKYFISNDSWAMLAGAACTTKIISGNSS